MKNTILKIYISIALITIITGCNAEENKLNETHQDEKFMLGTTLDNGKLIHFTYDVPYNVHLSSNEGSLHQALLYGDISLDEFINQLTYITMVNDGGSKLYKYDKNKKVFGDSDFYVLVCNSYDNQNNLYVAKYQDSLNDKCITKINDLIGVTMEIKKNTLTNTGATVVITDLSERKNIYGNPYRIDKFENNKWKELELVTTDTVAWTTIGYYVDEFKKLEFDINWEWLYGKLKKGKYRIVKETSIQGEGTKHYITAEFVIE